MTVFSSNSRTPYFEALRNRIRELGGMHNAHLHLDRAGTFDDRYFSEANLELADSNHISLGKKHALIAKVHSGLAYEREDLERRVRSVLDKMVELGTRRADTMVDVTPDRVGTSALDLINEIKEDYSGRIELNTASYTPLGFKDDEPERWEIFEKGVTRADFIGSLPEADDKNDYPDHIGFKEQCRRVLELANSYNKGVHFHVDQRNEPSERGTEQVIESVKAHGSPVSEDGEPMIWMVHMLSPSTYPDDRFKKLAQDLADLNIGVICCPSAAIGMRQLRPIFTPTYNSIPRVLELLSSGVKLRLASDNIAEICSPSTTADLVDEVFVLSAAIRFYNVDILASLAAGKDLTVDQISLIDEHLENNEREMQKVINKYHA